MGPEEVELCGWKLAKSVHRGSYFIMSHVRDHPDCSMTTGVVSSNLDKDKCLYCGMRAPENILGIIKMMNL